MTWKRPLISDALEQQMLSDRASLTAGMKSAQLADGRTMRYFDEGRGEAIVFMPMIPELNFIYAPQIAHFSGAYRTLTYEPLLSRTRVVGIKDRAEQTCQLLDVLGIKAAHLVAWSDGGAAACELARLWPERCLSLVLLCLPDRYRLPPVRSFLTKVLRYLPVEKVLPDLFVRRILAHYLGGPRVPPPLIERYARDIPQLTRLFKFSALPNLYQHQPQAGQIAAPALLITGKLDTLVTVDQARSMARLMPNARDVVVLDSGEHLLSFAQADEVNAAIESFLKSLRPAEVRG